MDENGGEPADTGLDAGESALEPGQQNGFPPGASAPTAEAGEHEAASPGEAPGPPGEQCEDTGKDQEESKSQLLSLSLREGQAQGPGLAGEEVAAWAEEPPAAGPAQVPERPDPQPKPSKGAAKGGTRGPSMGRSKGGAAEGKEGQKARWGMGSKKGLEDRMAQRSFTDREASPAKGDSASLKRSGEAKKSSKARDVSPVITRTDQKEMLRKMLAERQQEEKHRLEQRIAAKTAFLQTIKETLRNEAASRQLSAYLEKKRAQRERCYLKKYGRLPAHRLDAEVSSQLLPPPASLPRSPPLALSGSLPLIRKGLPSVSALLVPPPGSPAAASPSSASPSAAPSPGAASNSSQPGSPSRPPWNASPKFERSDCSSDGGSPLARSGGGSPMAAPETLHFTARPAREHRDPTDGPTPASPGGPKAAGRRSSKKVHDMDPEMQVLKAVRRREELLGRLRTLLLAKGGTTDSVPHSGSVAACLDSLRGASLDAVEAVQAWRVEQGHQQRPFVWAGQDYLAKMNTDLGNLLAKEPAVQAWLGLDVELDPFCTGLVPAPAPSAPPPAARYQPALEGSQALRVKAALRILADAAGTTAQLTKQRMELLGSPTRGSRNLNNKQPLASPAPQPHPPPAAVPPPEDQTRPPTPTTATPISDLERRSQAAAGPAETEDESRSDISALASKSYIGVADAVVEGGRLSAVGDALDGSRVSEGGAGLGTSGNILMRTEAEEEDGIGNEAGPNPSDGTILEDHASPIWPSKALQSLASTDHPEELQSSVGSKVSKDPLIVFDQTEMGPTNAINHERNQATQSNMNVIETGVKSTLQDLLTEVIEGTKELVIDTPH